LVLEPSGPLPLGCLVLPWLLDWGLSGCLAGGYGAAGASNHLFISLHPSPSAAHLSCNGGRVAQLLRGGSWINNPHNCRAAFRNSNHPDTVNSNVGVRPGCLSPPAPFTARAVGRASSGSTRRVTDPRVQTRSGDRRSPLARPAPSQRPHDPHNPGPLPHGPRPGMPGGLSLSGRSHPPHLPGALGGLQLPRPPQGRAALQRGIHRPARSGFPAPSPPRQREYRVGGPGRSLRCRCGVSCAAATPLRVHRPGRDLVGSGLSGCAASRSQRGDKPPRLNRPCCRQASHAGRRDR
jgi:hypothetical protein